MSFKSQNYGQYMEVYKIRRAPEIAVKVPRAAPPSLLFLFSLSVLLFLPSNCVDPYLTMPSPRGVLFLLSVFLPMVSALPAIVLLLPFSRSLYRKAVQFGAYASLTFIVFMIEWFCGTRIVLHSAMPAPGERCVIMSNHQCRVDWMFLWAFYSRARLLHIIRIVLKDDLKKIPAIGTYMQALLFLFLERNNPEKDMRTRSHKLECAAPKARPAGAKRPLFLRSACETGKLREVQRPLGRPLALKQNLVRGSASVNQWHKDDAHDGVDGSIVCGKWP
jgi:1-acyl-sn-glycerol-3-phosphate acyltransferase